MRNLNLIFLLLISVSLSAQNNKLLKKANKAYKYENYAQAIPLYLEYLTDASNYSARTKLANCYFKINKPEKARIIYESLVDNDKVKSRTIYNYAQTLVSAGEYEIAKDWFIQYQRLKPDDEQAARFIKACDEVKNLKPYFELVHILDFPYNSPYDDNSPVFYKDGIVFSSDRKNGLLSGKSGWTGRGYVNIYFAPVKDSMLSQPRKFSLKLNAISRNNATASFTEDYSEVYFTRNSSEFSKRNSLNMQLYSGETAGGNRWKNIKRLPFCNIEFNYMHPAVSPDGKYLFFTSNKSGGEGKMDIFYCTRKKDGWGNPVNLGPIVNTPENEGFPFAYYDNQLFFCSKGHSGFGGFDIFVTTQDKHGQWTPPVNLGQPINSPSDDISFFLTKDKSQGLLASSRDGDDDDIFMIYFSDIALQQAKVTPPPLAEKNPEDATDLAETTGINTAPPEGTAPTATSTTEDIADVEMEMPKATQKDSAIALAVSPGKMPATATPEQTPEPAPQPTTEITAESMAGNIAENAENTTTSTTPAGPALEDSLEKRDTSSKIVKVIPAINKIKISTVVHQEKSEVQPEKSEIQAVISDKNNMPEASNETTIPAEFAGNTSPDLAASPPVNPGNIEIQTTASQQEICNFLKDFLDKNEGNTSKTFLVKDLNFGLFQYQLTQEHKTILKAISTVLLQFPARTLEIGSHTSSLGEDEKNIMLSQFRADAISEFLQAEGCPKDQLKAVGYGEQKLLNECRNGKACTQKMHLENERVEIRIIK